MDFLKIKEILDDNIIGKLIKIESIEQVSYWHQAHSFVRGNWRNDIETSPMIMQKCCHDFDLMQYYVSSKCDTSPFPYNVINLIRDNIMIKNAVILRRSKRKRYYLCLRRNVF